MRQKFKQPRSNKVEMGIEGRQLSPELKSVWISILKGNKAGLRGSGKVENRFEETLKSLEKCQVRHAGQIAKGDMR